MPRLCAACLSLIAPLLALGSAGPAAAQTVGLSTWAQVDAKAFGGARCIDDHTGIATASASCLSSGSGAATNGTGEAAAAFGSLRVKGTAGAEVFTSDGGGTSVYAQASFVDRLSFGGLSPAASYTVALLFPITGSLTGNGFLESGCTVRANLPLGGAPERNNGGPLMSECNLLFTTTGDVLRSGFFATAELGVHLGAGGSVPGLYSAIGDYSHTMLLGGITLTNAVTGAVIDPQLYTIASASGTSYPVPVPEPATGLTMLAGLALALAARACRRGSGPGLSA